MSQAFVKKLIPILEELSEHTFDEAVITSGDLVISIRQHTDPNPADCVKPGTAAAGSPSGDADVTTVYTPKAGTLVLPSAIRQGARVEAGEEIARLRVLDKTFTVYSERSGTIAAVLAQAGDFVEYRQALFTLRPEA